MKKLYIVMGLIFFLSTGSYAQDKLEITYANHKIYYKETNQLYGSVEVHDSSLNGSFNSSFIEANNVDRFGDKEENGNFKNISIHFANPVLLISNKNDSTDSLRLFFCTKSKKFTFKESGCDAAIARSNTDIEAPPYPYFSKGAGKTISDIDSSHSKRTRVFIIDARPSPNKNNNTLYRVKDLGSGSSKLVAIKNLPANGSLSIFIRGYNFDSLENLNITLTGADYAYQESVLDLYTQIQTGKANSSNAGVSEETGQKDHGEPTDANIENIISPTDTLYQHIYRILSMEYDAMNINVLKELNEYKAKLRAFVNSEKANGLSLSPRESEWYSKILRWSPTYVGLTPFNINIPDNDEIEILMTIKQKDESASKDIPLGNFRGAFSWGRNLGNTIYVTNLVNHSVYTDTTGGQKIARLDKTGGTSVGIGVNGGITYHTGTSISPILNLGVFIPFDEDISPFFALGSGINIGSKNVSFGLSGGAALGKINAIVSQFKNVDLTGMDLANDQLTEKVWKVGWQLAIGLQFNLSSTK